MAHLCTQMHLRGSAVDMESDNESSGDKPDGCEVEDAPTAAPSNAAVDAPPTQNEGEAFAASSSTVHRCTFQFGCGHGIRWRGLRP